MNLSSALSPRKILTGGLLSMLLFVLIPATEASAGRLLVTGHDWDLHCSGGQQCHYTKVGVNFVRGDSNKKVLVVDQPDYDVDVALDNAFNEDFPRKIVEPTSAAWRNANLTPKKYSAILIASDTSCGGCDLNQNGLEDSRAINKRKGAIKRYFNKGGGIMVGAGASHGDGNDDDDIYYNFLPIPVGGEPVSPPFCLTDLGIDLGFHDQACPRESQRNGTQNDINCCATHNSFNKPKKSSALEIAEKDSDGLAETLVAVGNIRGGDIVDDEPKPKLRLTVRPRQATAGQRTCFEFTVTSEGDRVRGSTVEFGGERDRTNKHGRTTICRTFGSPGRQRAEASKGGFRDDSTSVDIVPAGSNCRATTRC
jgi:hypothetical protein